MSARVEVAPAVLRWAEERSEREPGAFPKKFPSWQSWIEGAVMPTVRQLEEVSKYAHVPFGTLFLHDPPKVELPISDFRLGAEADRTDPSVDLLAVIAQSQRRQDWFEDFASRVGAGATRLRPASTEDDPAEVAKSISDQLHFSVSDRARLRTRENARNHLRKEFEHLGGLTVFTSMVGNDVHRMLERSEFRGFTLASESAPLIFVNTNGDSLSGQFFTFLHEVAHASRRETGVSGIDLEMDQESVEGWCNRVAAEVLVPVDDLIEQFDGSKALVGELDRLSNRYFASTLVILLQLRRADALPNEGFRDLFLAEERRAKELFDKSRAQAEGGGNFYLNQPFRVGERLSKAILLDLRAGGTSFTEAFRLLQLRNTKQLNKYAQQLGL